MAPSIEFGRENSKGTHRDAGLGQYRTVFDTGNLKLHNNVTYSIEGRLGQPDEITSTRAPEGDAIATKNMPGNNSVIARSVVCWEDT